MAVGTYTILLKLQTETEVEFGAAGSRELQAGYYAYTGSAFGPNGLSRIDRHRRVADGKNSTRHWHIDYLLGSANTKWVDHRTVADRDVECAIAAALDGTPIAGIGATDCRCSTHLWFESNGQRLRDSIESVYRDASSGAQP